MSAILDGVRVLEFSQVIAAPVAGQILAEMGADVLKVEPPGGESWRLQAMFAPTESKSFQSLNRGKRAMTLNLGSDAAREVAHRLTTEADVVLINYRPDVPAKFGIDYEALKAIKLDLIYVDLTAFGRRGPWALRPGYDGVVQAVTGLMAAEGKLQDDGSPGTISSTAVADYSSGIVLANAIVAALYEREKTGEGQFVECSLFATALSLQGDVVMELPSADEERNSRRDARHALAQQSVPFAELVAVRRGEETASPGERVYLTSDGAIAVSASVEELYAVTEAGGEDALADAFLTRRDDEWQSAFDAAGVAASIVRFPEDLGDHPHSSANALFSDYVHDVHGPQRHPAPVLRFDGADAVPPKASPPLGRDTVAALRDAGFDAREIEELAADGVIGAEAKL